MEKIKLTQKQANGVLERKAIIDKSATIEHHINEGWEDPKNKWLNNLTVDELCRLLYVPDSYEVIPQYNENDWVYRNREIDSIRWANYEKNLAYLDSIGMIGIDSIERHATPEEIQQEKKRRFWDKLGRDVDEFKPGDIVSFHSVLTNLSGSEINKGHVEFPTYTDLNEYRVEITKVRLITPVEQRLDK